MSFQNHWYRLGVFLQEEYIWLEWSPYTEVYCTGGQKEERRTRTCGVESDGANPICGYGDCDPRDVQESNRITYDNEVRRTDACSWL